MQTIFASDYPGGFVITGLLYNSTKRFKRTTHNIYIAFGINLWRGNVWGIDKNGKRKRLKSVWN